MMIPEENKNKIKKIMHLKDHQNISRSRHIQIDRSRILAIGHIKVHYSLVVKNTLHISTVGRLEASSTEWDSSRPVGA